MIFIHHWLFRPETLLLTLNPAAVRDTVQGKEFAMPAALSPGPKSEVQPIPNTKTASYDVIRRDVNLTASFGFGHPLFGYQVDSDLES